MKRTINMVKVIAIILAILVSLAGLFTLRLSMGPMSIGFLDGVIRQSLDNAFPDIDVQFEEPSLYWNKQEDSLDLQISKVVFSKTDGEMIANSPYVGITISMLALLEGRVQPTQLDLIGATVELEWNSQQFLDHINNDHGIVSGPAQIMQAQEKPAILTLIHTLMGATDTDDPLSKLVSVSIIDADIWLDEVISGVRWHLPKTRMQFLKANGGLNLSADAWLEVEDSVTPLKVRTLSQAGETVAFRFEFGEVNLAYLARTVNLDGMFETLDLPIFGSATIGFDVRGTPTNTLFNIGGGGGVVHIPELYEIAPQLDQLEVIGSYDHAERFVSLETINIELGEASLTADGIFKLANSNSKAELSLFAKVVNMPIRNSLIYWPQRVARGGHEWVSKHAPEGMVDEANFIISIKPDYWGQKPLPEDAFHLDFKFSDLTAHYLRPLPPLVNAMGAGVITPNNLNIDVFSGQTDGIDINPSNFTVKNAGYVDLRRGFATFSMTTPIPRLLRFIDQDPINRNKSYDINPDDFEGQATTVGHFDFPLVKGNSFANVNMLVNVKTEGGGIPNLMTNGSLTDANLDIVVSKEGISATGPIAVKGVPLELYWTEQFKPNDDNSPRSRYEVTGDVSAEQVSRFGVPAVGRMEGTARVNMSIRGNGKELIDGEGTADLFQTIVHSPKLAWWKSANTPGEAKFNIKWSDETFWLDNLTVDSHMNMPLGDSVKLDNFTTQATMHFDKATGRLLEAYVPRLHSLGHELSMAINLSIDDYIELIVEADRVDLSAYLDDLVRGPQGTNYIPEALIIINARQATALNGVSMKNFKLDAWNTGGYWATSDMRGEFADGEGEFSLLLNGTFEGRHIKVLSDNAGKMALAAGLFLNGQGGTLDLSADLGPPQSADEISGSLSIENFRVVKSSPFVLALEASHGYGVDKLIDADGIKFKELLVPFSISNGVIDINEAKANGPSIGFTMEGQVNQRSRRMNLNGLIIPAYTLNNFLGSIPIIGNILGGKDGGLFALSYRIQGVGGEADFSFNPLSAIAPGFLRKLFEGRRGTVDSNEGFEIDITDDLSDIVDTPETVSTPDAIDEAEVELEPVP